MIIVTMSNQNNVYVSLFILEGYDIGIEILLREISRGSEYHFGFGQERNIFWSSVWLARSLESGYIYVLEYETEE